MTDQADATLRDYFECVQFLDREADLLDTNDLEGWLAMLTDDIDYRVPVRSTQGRSLPDEFSETAFFYKEDFDSLRARVDRLETEYDWSEDPPSRTRRFVSNVKVEEVGDEELRARNNLMLYRTRNDTTDYDLLTCERQDVLRRVDGDLRLAERRALLDQTVLGLRSGRSLTVFI